MKRADDAPDRIWRIFYNSKSYGYEGPIEELISVLQEIARQYPGTMWIDHGDDIGFFVEREETAEEEAGRKRFEAELQQARAMYGRRRG